MICTICGREAEELCPDGVCRACHVSVSWDDCNNKTWDARLSLQAGVPLDLVKKIHPQADHEKLIEERT